MEPPQEATPVTVLDFFRFWYATTQLRGKGVGHPPFVYQEKMIDQLVNANRPLVINKARQTGISTVIASVALSDAVFRGWPVLICSNKEENATHILEYAGDFIDSLKKMPLKLPKVDTDKTSRLTFENGGEIRCFAANPSTARGYPAKRVFFDEFAHFTKEIDLDRRMMEAVGPSIAQVGGTLTMLSTPNGTKNEFYRTWDRAPVENRMTVHYSECPTLKVREEPLPFGKQYWIEGLPAPFPESSFKQEFCNDFYVGSDEAIPLEALRAALKAAEGATEPSIDGQTTYYIGADIGYTHDATAYCVVARVPAAAGESAEALWVVEVRILTREPFNEQVRVLNELVARYKPARLVMDRTFNPQSTEQALADHPYITEPFVFGDQSKRDLLSKAGSFFTASQVRCPMRNRQVIDEIANIKKVISPAGNIQFKDNPHGDIGWACLLALWGVPTNPQRTSAAGMWPCEACQGQEPAKTRCGRCGGTGVHVFQF